MALHDSLRELVSVRGPGVVDEAEEFRGVLDDFLAEDEASLGELNLLVDAVRLGALRRVLDVLAHGAAPEAAVREAGAALARDRGTDDPTRSCWALASLCFALGKVDDSLVRMFRADTGTMPAATPPTAPNGPEPAVAPGHGTAERPETQVLSEQSPVSQPVAPQPVAPQPVYPSPTVDVQSFGTPQYSGPVPPVIHEQRSSRAGVYLLVVLVALLLGGLIAAGVILLGNDDDGAKDEDDTTASENPSPSDKGTKGPGKKKPLVPDDVMLVPYVEGGFSRIYQVNATTGESEPVTPEGVDAKLPSISPDRRTMTYQTGKPGLVMVVDLATLDTRPLFPEDSPCANASRPSWSPDGSRLAVLCNTDRDPDSDPDGLWLADADGSGVTEEPLIDEPDVKGTPIWISDTELIYGVDDATVGSTFWRASVDGGTPTQVPVDIPGYLSHLDYSEEADLLLVLASPSADESEGAIWTLDVDGDGLTLVVDGPYAHPAWSVDGTAIGATVVDSSSGEEVLTSVVLKDDGTGTNLIVPNVPAGEVGIPAWGTR